MSAGPRTAVITGPPGFAFRLTAMRGRLPLGAVFGTILALGGAAVGLLGLDRLPLSVCLFKALSGLPCPTCGSTRALGRLVRMDGVGALLMNPLATLGFVLLALWALADFALLPRGRALGFEIGRPLARTLRYAALLALLANWAYLLMVGR